MHIPCERNLAGKELCGGSWTRRMCPRCTIQAWAQNPRRAAVTAFDSHPMSHWHLFSREVERLNSFPKLVHLAVAVIIFQLGGLVRNVSSARLPWLVFTVTPRGLIRIVRSLGLSRQPAWGEIRSSLAEISFHHPPGACSLLNHRITGARDALPPLDIIDVVILATVGDALNTRVSLPQHVGATFAGHVLFQICQHASAFYLREVHDHRPPRCPS